MDKTEMYNKVSNAIYVLSRIEGEKVDVYEGHGREMIYLGEIAISKKATQLKLIVSGLDITDKVERLDLIYKKLLSIYENQQKKKEESKLERMESYLNSFVGK